MAIIKCRECKNQVSSEAKICPHCGIKKPKPSLGCLPLIIVVIAFGYFSGKFSDKNENENVEAANTQSTLGLLSTPKINIPPIPATPFTPQQVCKAAISTIFGRPTNIIKVNNSSDNVHYLSYVRPEDKKIWKFKCKLSGIHVVWTEEGYDSDRWLGKGVVENWVTFASDGKTLKITEKYSDGSVNSKSYKVNQL